ncbi:MAG: cupredoxin domain-containing protein [Actinomycetota bacterium]
MRRTMLFPFVLLFLLAGAGTAHAATITIETQDNKFVPENATANVGDTIVFKNTGVAPHNAQSSDRTVFIDIINAGAQKSVVVKEAGTINYVCSFHVTLGMEGVLTVAAAGDATPADDAEPTPAAGDATPAGDAEPTPAAGAPAAGAQTPAATPAPTPTPTPAEEAAPDAPVTQKYLPPVGALLGVLLLLGLGLPFKQHLVPVLKSAPVSYEPAPVGAPAPIASPVVPAAAATVAPAAAPPTVVPAAPPAAAAPAPLTPPAPAGPVLDPEKVYQAVLKEETDKGTDPRVAEARAKAARMRTEEQSPAAGTASLAAPAAATQAFAPAEAQAPAAPSAPAAASAASGPKMSAEEAAAVRKRVFDDEIAKGTDPRVAEGRAKAAEMRAKKGTSGPK